jgi:Cyclin, N-terminal domain
MKTISSSLQVLRQLEDDRWYWKGDYLSTSSTPRSYMWMSVSTESQPVSSKWSEVGKCCQTKEGGGHDPNGNEICRECSNNVISSSESSSVVDEFDDSEWTNLDVADSNSSNFITPTDRGTMILWCHQVLSYCQINNLETIEMIASYIDRYCWISYKRHVKQNKRQHAPLHEAEHHIAGLPCCQHSYYQLLTVTCFYIALKLHESHAMHPRTLCKLSNFRFTERQIIDLEMQILFELNWKMSPPTIGSFIQYSIEELIVILNQKKRKESDNLVVDGLIENDYRSLSDIARRHAENAILDYNIVSVKASVVAYCCILNACQVILSEKSNISDHLKDDTTYRTIETHLANILDLIPNDARLRLLQDYLQSLSCKASMNAATSSSTFSANQVDQVSTKESLERSSSSASVHSVTNDKDRQARGTIFSKKQKQSDSNIIVAFNNQNNHHQFNKFDTQGRIQSSIINSHMHLTTESSSAFNREIAILNGSRCDDVIKSGNEIKMKTYSSKSITSSPQCISVSPSRTVHTLSLLPTTSTSSCHN